MMQSADEVNLRRQWSGLWKQIVASKARIPLPDDLLARYNAPVRAYHNVHHINQCLRELCRLRTLAERPDEVELAIWFHDAVYDPIRPDNEERSADMAADFIRKAGLQESVAERVRDLILATRHTQIPQSQDARLLTDIDLSILGQPPAVFDEYERGIRIEYAHVDVATFRRERAKILRRFLSGPIYHTEMMRSWYEAQARENLARSIAKLEPRPVR